MLSPTDEYSIRHCDSFTVIIEDKDLTEYPDDCSVVHTIEGNTDIKLQLTPSPARIWIDKGQLSFRLNVLSMDRERLPIKFHLSLYDLSYDKEVRQEVFQVYHKDHVKGKDIMLLDLKNKHLEGSDILHRWPYNCSCLKGHLVVLCEVQILEPQHEKSHMEKMSTDFSMLFESGFGSDVTLVANSSATHLPITIHAHKLILNVRSAVFSAMFSHKFKETRDSVVQIEDISAEVLQLLIRYMYSGSLQVDEHTKIHLLELLQAADKYALLPLKAECESHLSYSLSEENVSEIIAIADLHQSAALKRQARHYIAHYFNKVVTTKGWDRLVTSRPDLVQEIKNTRGHRGIKRAHDGY